VNETKTFSLRIILSVTTGRLLTKSKDKCDNGISDLYELLGYMTNDEPFTHQLPRFSEECKPWLLRWFPELELLTSEVNEFCDNLSSKEDLSRAAIDSYLLGLEEKIGKDEFEVPRIPMDDHEKKHPYDELVAMRVTDVGIVITEVSRRHRRNNLDT